ncbi:hypothetical protein [Nocardia veterana]|uniref:Uncharacterized protein n=1 Tax=Nocardia veterana TaxID=132249 RepID=A0A7X6M250_9NOCA|nr:hypothetical protein [Nocardia veterana]NKY88811.1 hypothetical protein [Nocardia veterana]
MTDEQSPGARLFSHEAEAVDAPGGGTPGVVPRPTFLAPQQKPSKRRIES